jgi:glutaminase
MNYDRILNEIYTEVKPLFRKGKVSQYIPALASVPPTKFGMAVCTLNGDTYTIGDAREKFSIQSISKVYSLTLVFKIIGEKLWTRVGKEPSGNPFNSLVQLEYERGIPRNPLINAGSLVIADILLSKIRDTKNAILEFVRKTSGNTTIDYDNAVIASEKITGHRNFALAHFMQSFNNIHNPVDDVLDVYFHHCGIEMTCVDLARSFLFLANHGVIPATNEEILTKSEAKRINALLLTCGLYDESGDFAFRVGLPGKSGIGGGIVAVLPENLSVAVWGPSLGASGNSLAGIKALELFTTKTGMSVF